MNSKYPIAIAYAEAHLAVRNALIRTIESVPGFRVLVSAGNGKELLEQIAKLSLLPDICMLDIRMPVMDGYDTLLALKQRWSGMKILIFSEFGNELAILRMMKYGADGFITKDQEDPVIFEAITTIYNGGTYFLEGKKLLQTHEYWKDSDKIMGLTPNELLFLKWCSTECTIKAIADRMALSPRTIEGYVEKLCGRFQVSSRLGLALYARNAGI